MKKCAWPTCTSPRSSPTDRNVPDLQLLGLATVTYHEYSLAMRIESDIAGALGSEDSEPSQASEMEVMRPHLMDSIEAAADRNPPPPRPSARVLRRSLVWCW